MPLDGGTRVDTNGIYYFTLVPDGIYLLQAIPDATDQYVPTYYGGTTSWQAAPVLTPVNFNSLVNIYLAATLPLNPGPASVSGKISYVYGGNGNTSPMKVILMDESLMPLDFTDVDQEGKYEFRDIGYGVYYLRAEMAGAVAENMRFELSAGSPDLIVNMDYNGYSILGLTEDVRTSDFLKVFPNPAGRELSISLEGFSGSMEEISIYSSTGQKVMEIELTVSATERVARIAVDHLPRGMYIVRLKLETGEVCSAKFLKNG